MATEIEWRSGRSRHGGMQTEAPGGEPATWRHSRNRGDNDIAVVSFEDDAGSDPSSRSRQTAPDCFPPDGEDAGRVSPQAAVG
jgi:hypothetical protein